MKNHLINFRSLILLAISFILVLPSAFCQDGGLRVGAARVEVTSLTKPEYPPSGEFDHENLFVRAIVIDNGETRAVFVSCDGSISGESYKNLSPVIIEEIGCPAENIIMSSTHSHRARLASSPDNAIMDAIRKAKESMKPAKVGFGEGESYLNVNRDAISKKTRLWTQAANLEGPSDKTVAVILFTDLQGTPIAGYMNYAMHPVNGYLTGVTSADFPGPACRHIEKSFRDEMVMIFTQGASGDQNPRWLRPATNVMASKSGVEITGYELVREDVEAPLRDGQVSAVNPDPGVIETFERWIDALGLVLGEEVIRVMTNIDEFQNDVRIWGQQETITLPGRKRLNTGREGSPGTYEDGDPVNICLGLLGIGNIAVTTVNAEVYNPIAVRMKKASPLTNTMMVTIVNERAASGYIIDDPAYGRYTFQVLGTRLKPGYAEKSIADGLVNLIQKYMNQY